MMVIHDEEVLDILLPVVIQLDGYVQTLPSSLARFCK